MQLPIGEGENFEGVIDLISERAIYFDGNSGEDVREESIPEEFESAATSARQHMLESLAMYSDELMELLLSEESVPRRACSRGREDGRARRRDHPSVSRHCVSKSRCPTAVGCDCAILAFSRRSGSFRLGTRQFLGAASIEARA